MYIYIYIYIYMCACTLIKVKREGPPHTYTHVVVWYDACHDAWHGLKRRKALQHVLFMQKLGERTLTEVVQAVGTAGLFLLSAGEKNSIGTSCACNCPDYSPSLARIGLEVMEIGVMLLVGIACSFAGSLIGRQPSRGLRRGQGVFIHAPSRQ